MKKIMNFVFGRMLYTVIFIAVQLATIFLMFRFFSGLFGYFYIICIAISIFTALHVLASDMNPAYKIAWLVPILIFPIFGGLMYLMFGKTELPTKAKKRKSKADAAYKSAMELFEKEKPVFTEPEAALQSSYITAVTGGAPFCKTETQYLPIGEEYFRVLEEELEKAEHFIFLEYFIIREGKLWSDVLEILKRKASEGVEVRIIYDDMGCMFTLPWKYDRELEKLGIKTAIFHRFDSILNARFNTRDHRKICVIDGNVGITGGINISDEYANIYPKYGKWKDSGILLRGEAVWSLTAMFLSLWKYIRGGEEDFSAYAPEPEKIAEIENDGIIQPYTDTPFDNEPAGRTVYINMINRAKKYVYITTPYLIIDSETVTALRTAAFSGIDVRIIVPGVPDKKMVYDMTRSYYEPLLSAGVRIYEYSPGFIHAKNFVSDDEYAVVGTINLDFRSLYLHYECAAWMYGTKAVADVKKDYLETLEVCKERTLDSLPGRSFFRRIYLAVLKAFAPLM